MRFCDLFFEYKIGLKELKSTIPFKKLPLYRKITLIIFLICIIVTGILLIFIQDLVSFIPAGIGLISLVAFFINDSRKSNLKEMLEEHYIPYSKKRMNMTIKVLKKYNIDIENLDSLNMLIDETKHAQVQADYLLQFKKALKVLSATIIPIIVFVAKKIGNESTQSEMLYMAATAIILIILIFSLILVLAPIVNDLFYRDYNKYNELINDLRQLKLFYAKNNH